MTPINGTTPYPVDVVSRADFDAFRAEYATLFEIAAKQGVHHLALKAALEVKGVVPAGFVATFYRRKSSGS